MNCIILDDDPLARKGIEKLLSAEQSVQLKGCFNNAVTALEYLSLNPVDLVFADIQMPGMTGLEMARQLGTGTLVVFITAHPGYAVDSYAVDALDYLVKPLNRERFQQCIQKAKAYLQLLKADEHQKETTCSMYDDYIFVKSGRLFHKVQFSDIAYIEGLKDYVVIHHQQQKLLTALNVRTIQAQLPASQFVRVSKSYLVNLRHISTVSTYAVFIGNTEIPIGDSYRKVFFEDFVKRKALER